MIRLQFICEKCGGTKHYIPSKASVIMCATGTCHHEHRISVTREINYVSFRKHPLVTQFITGWSTDGEPHAHLTVEDYEKWYGAEIIHIDGTIERLTFGDFGGAIEGPDSFDHCINPSSFHATAQKLKLKYDNKTFAAVCERWVDDFLDGDWTKLHHYLPKEPKKVQEPQPPKEIKTGPFTSRGEEEVGKVFTARRRCPSYEKAEGTISPGDKFEIEGYLDYEGIYMLKNLSRRAGTSCVGNEELLELIDPEIKIVLELATRPGIPNRNGIVYTQEAFDTAKALVKKRINMGLATARIGIPVVTVFSDILITPPRDAQFKILSIEEESATLTPIQMDKYKELQMLMEENKFVLAMNYIGIPDENNVVNKITIGSFSIIPKPYGSDKNEKY